MSNKQMDEESPSGSNKIYNVLIQHEDDRYQP